MVRKRVKHSERRKIVKSETPSGKIYIVYDPDKPRPIRFKSYPRVSQVLLFCTSSGVRPYMSTLGLMFCWTVASMGLRYSNLTKRIGLMQSVHHPNVTCYHNDIPDKLFT